MMLSQITILQLAVLIVGTLTIFAQSHSLEGESDPFHVSWTTKNQSRFDIVYNLKAPLKNVIKLGSLKVNATIEKSMLLCTGYHACLLEDGHFVVGYNLNNNSTETDKILFKSPPNTKSSNNTSISCQNEIQLYNHCSTHWNPPVHISGDKEHCRHMVNWHSPYSCHSNTTNYEHPCYTYDASGNLIDLTSWVVSNGSSYAVDTGNFNKTVKQFNLNVCNDAHDLCGPNISACYFDGNNTVESGYNNSTSIRYDTKEKAVLLTSLGQYDDRCSDKRTRTVVRFVCKNKVVPNPKPRLIRNDICESIVEWETIHACPFSEISAPATKCAIKYQPLNIDLDLKKLIKNETFVEIKDMNLEKGQKTMVLGLCRGIPSSKLKNCEGKQLATTASCLVDSSSKNSTKSAIVASIQKSNIRLVDSRLYLEYFSPTKTCQVPMGHSFSATSRVGTRIEFFCSEENDIKPKYIGIEDCVYVFEWGWKAMCLESLGTFKGTTNTSMTSPKIGESIKINPNMPKLSDKELKIDLNDEKKSAQEDHNTNVEDAKKTINTNNHSNLSEVADHKSKSTSSQSSPVSSPTITAPPALNQSEQVPTSSNNRMNKLHKFFMIGLIVMSLAAFIIVIFILDKKTQLRIPLTNIRRHARQAFQPPPVPYTRVGQFNDLDLS